jgi:hypothetical protein
VGAEDRSPALEQGQDQERRRVPDDVQHVRPARGHRRPRNASGEQGRRAQRLTRSAQVHALVLVLGEPGGQRIHDGLASASRVGKHVDQPGHYPRPAREVAMGAPRTAAW